VLRDQNYHPLNQVTAAKTRLSLYVKSFHDFMWNTRRWSFQRFSDETTITIIKCKCDNGRITSNKCWFKVNFVSPLPSVDWHVKQFLRARIVFTESHQMHHVIKLLLISDKHKKAFTFSPQTSSSFFWFLNWFVHLTFFYALNSKL
jgi:hypothetical protein